MENMPPRYMYIQCHTVPLLNNVEEQSQERTHVLGSNVHVPGIHVTVILPLWQ